MLRVKHNDITYEIAWVHDDAECDPRSTACEVVLSMREVETTSSRSGVATCSHLDNFNRNVGRRISLARLRALSSTSSPPGPYTPIASCWPSPGWEA